MRHLTRAVKWRSTGRASASPARGALREHGCPYERLSVGDEVQDAADEERAGQTRGCRNARSRGSVAAPAPS